MSFFTSGGAVSCAKATGANPQLRIPVPACQITARQPDAERRGATDCRTTGLATAPRSASGSRFLDPPVTLPAAGYDYNSGWTPSAGGTFTRRNDSLPRCTISLGY
jgi:hypothetical protein